MDFVKEVGFLGSQRGWERLFELETGETRRFWIPGKLGFGATAEESRGLPPGLGLGL